MAADKKAIEDFVKSCRSGSGFAASADAASDVEVTSQVIAFGNAFSEKIIEKSAVTAINLRMIVQIGLSLVDVFVKDTSTAASIRQVLNLILQFLPGLTGHP